MFGFSRWPIGRQIFILALALCVLVFGTLIAMATYSVEGSATRTAEENLRAQLKVTADLMEYAYGQAVGRGARNSERFVKSLPGAITVDAKPVKTGDAELPALYAGKVLLNGNSGVLEHFRDTFGSEEAILIQHNGKLYRAATLLKGKDGAYMIGSVIPKGDPLEISFSKGEETRSIVERNGRTYASHMLPVKDAQGQVIAAISTRVDLTKDIDAFKKILLGIKFGKTGFVYAFRANGDETVGSFTVHPKAEGKALNEVYGAHPTVLARLREIIAAKSGSFTYDWTDGEGAQRPRFAALMNVPSWGWMLGGGSYVDEFLDEARDLRNKLLVTGFIAGAAMLGLMVWLVMRRVAKLKPVLAAMQKQGEGDLTATVAVPEGASANEFDVLATSFNDSAARVRGLVQRLAEVSTRVGGSSDALERSAGEIARATAQQSEAAASMAASVEELTVSISHVADGAGEASSATQAAQAASSHGNDAVSHSITEMRRIAEGIDGTAAQINALGERSREISGIIKVIGEIAGQTNLLALNAAIEAARAGEQGRGFAVVADEVRKLSERTGTSAQEISKMIGAIQSDTESAVARMNAVAKEMGSGVALVQDVGASLGQIDGRTRDTAALAGQIASAVAEQKVASEDIARRLEAIAQAAEENAALTGNNRDVAQDLRNCADELAGEIGRFRV